MADKDSSAGLLPSTVSQWLPKSGLSAPSEDQVLTDGTVPAVLSEVRPTSYNPALTPRQGEQNPLIASEIRSGFTAETPSSVPAAIPSANSDLATKTASGPTKPTKLEASPTSVPELAPRPAPDSTTSGNPKYILAPPPAATTSVTHNAPLSTDSEKVFSSTIPALNEKGTPASSNLDKEIDLEAGHRSEDSDKQEPETNKQEVDTNIVDWDGPDDPKKPMNWPEKLKWANVAVISSITFLT